MPILVLCRHAQGCIQIACLYILQYRDTLGTTGNRQYTALECEQLHLFEVVLRRGSVGRNDGDMGVGHVLKCQHRIGQRSGNGDRRNRVALIQYRHNVVIQTGAVAYQQALWPLIGDNAFG